MGLFGTVWGIMSAFSSLGNVQQATLAQVAPGIAEALVATAIGLFAAIPAVIAYNRYADQVTRLEMRYDAFMEEFSTILQRYAARGALHRWPRRPRRPARSADMAQTSRGRRLMGEINVVPYIDVMLVLLIIFMITAPLLTQGVKVELPKAAAEPLEPQQLKPLVLSIDRQGRLYLNIGGDPRAALDEPHGRGARRGGAARQPDAGGAGQGRCGHRLRARGRGDGDAAAGGCEAGGPGHRAADPGGAAARLTRPASNGAACERPLDFDHAVGAAARRAGGSPGVRLDDVPRAATAEPDAAHRGARHRRAHAPGDGAAGAAARGGAAAGTDGGHGPAAALGRGARAAAGARAEGGGATGGGREGRGGQGGGRPGGRGKSRRSAEGRGAEGRGAKGRAADKAAAKAAAERARQEQQDRTDREADLKRSLAAEEQAQAARNGAAMATWASQIAAKITHAWLRPPTARPG